MLLPFRWRWWICESCRIGTVHQGIRNPAFTTWRSAASLYRPPLLKIQSLRVSVSKQQISLFPVRRGISPPRSRSSTPLSGFPGNPCLPFGWCVSRLPDPGQQPNPAGRKTILCLGTAFWCLPLPGSPGGSRYRYGEFNNNVERGSRSKVWAYKCRYQMTTMSGPNWSKKYD